MKIMKTMTIDEKLLNKVSKLAIKKDRSESWIVNQILDEFFNGKAELTFEKIDKEEMNGKHRADNHRKANKQF
jgi:hypothetical protein